MAKHAHPRAHARAHGKHRKPRTTGPVIRTVVAAGGLTGGAIVAGAALAPAAHAATADDLARLRACESGGNYSTNTGNGFYGAYQFDLGTWNGLGYSGRPSDASPATQDAAARTLQSQRGWSPWPACSHRLGLGASHSAHNYVAATTSHPVVVSVPHVNGMSTYDDGRFRRDVLQLQNDLVFIGYNLGIDGHYGQQTDSVVRSFQKQAQLTIDGVAGPQTLRAVRDAKIARWQHLFLQRMRVS
jgi:peptidoglycan hydrolase-like protein with peptidoglycan-binding domain